METEEEIRGEEDTSPATVSAPTQALDPEPAIAELRRAVRFNDFETAKRLLADDPALAHAPSTRGGSLLLEAFEREAESIADLMASARDDRGITELNIHEACAMGRAGIVQKRLTDDPLLFEEMGPAGFLPLHRAAYRGHVDAVSLLLQMGADPNARSENGAALTALHSVVAGAVRFGGSSDTNQPFQLVTERLMAAGGDATLTMEGDWTPTSAAERDGREDLVALLCPTDQNPTVETPTGEHE